MQIAMHVCFSNFAFNFGNVNHKTGKKKNPFLKILCYGTYVVGFQTMVIMDLWGMAFHAVVVIAPFLAILFIWTSAYCE